MSRIIARIDRDHLAEKGEPNRVGTEWTTNALSSMPEEVDVLREIVDGKARKVRFRCLDDDDIPYYGGWLLNDEYCAVQFVVLRWAQEDAGCTTIEVRDYDSTEWKREIG